MPVFEVQHDPHPLGYLCVKFRFVLRPPLPSYPVEKNRVLNHSITYLPSLFDAPGIETFASEIQQTRFLTALRQAR